MVHRTRVSRTRHVVRDRHLLVLKSVPWRSRDLRSKPEKHPGKRRAAISSVLILAGGALCAYVGGTYAWMYARQRSLLREWNAHNPAVVRNLTKLSIPKIQLEDVVLEGASSRSLLLGPAHIEGTAEPGSQGNAVIAGHRDSFFRRLHSLRYGDEIYVMRDGHRFRYVVRERKIVEPTDLAVLQPRGDARITLITCYPTHAIGPAPKRLIVVAQLAPET